MRGSRWIPPSRKGSLGSTSATILATQGDPSLPGARRLDRAYVNHLVVVALGDQPDILPLAGSRVLTGEQAQLDESLSRSARIFEAIPSIELACSSRK